MVIEKQPTKEELAALVLNCSKEDLRRISEWVYTVFTGYEYVIAGESFPERFEEPLVAIWLAGYEAGAKTGKDGGIRH